MGTELIQIEKSTCDVCKTEMTVSLSEAQRNPHYVYPEAMYHGFGLVQIEEVDGGGFAVAKKWVCSSYCLRIFAATAKSTLSPRETEFRVPTPEPRIPNTVSGPAAEPSSPASALPPPSAEQEVAAAPEVSAPPEPRVPSPEAPLAR